MSAFDDFEDALFDIADGESLDEYQESLLEMMEESEDDESDED